MKSRNRKTLYVIEIAAPRAGYPSIVGPYTRAGLMDRYPEFRNRPGMRGFLTADLREEMVSVTFRRLTPSDAMYARCPLL